MAIYFCRLSHGKVGSGIPHYQYIHGLGKYSYKENEVAYKTEHMPEWASANGEIFFQNADEHEGANRAVYKEIKVALPNEFSLEKNQEILEEFLKKELGKNYYYSAVIHDKEIENGVRQNIHAHIMFSTRELDGVERNNELFFKKANTKNPHLGGCAKNPKWDSNNKKTVEEIRLSWEQTLNKHLIEHDIEPVSRLSLKEQYQNALLEKDYDKAKLLKRKAINCKMQILKKVSADIPLNRSEEKQYKKYLKAKEIKYRLEKEYEQIITSREKVNEKKIELNSIQEKLNSINQPQEFIDKKFNSFIEIEQELLKLEKEIQMIKSASSLSAVQISAIESIHTGFEKLHKEQDFYIDKLNSLENAEEAEEEKIKQYTSKVADIQEKIDVIVKTINPDILNKLTAEKKVELNEKLTHIQSEKDHLRTVRENLYQQADINKIAIDKVTLNNKFGSSLEKLVDLDYNLKVLTKNLSRTEKQLDEKNLKETAKNILTKGEYRKITEELNRCIDNMNSIARNINGGMYDDRKDLLIKKHEEYANLKEKLEVLKSKENQLNKYLGKSHSKLMKIEKSMENKLKTRREKLLDERFIMLQEIQFYKLYLAEPKTQDVKEVFNSKYAKYKDQVEIAAHELSRLEKIHEILKENLSHANLKNLAYNKITKGEYNKVLKEYGTLEKQIKDLETVKNSLSRLNPKVLILNGEINKLEKQKEDLKEKYKTMLKEIDPKVFKETLKSLENHRAKTLGNIKKQIGKQKNIKFEFTVKKSTIYKLREEVYPYSFEKFKAKANTLNLFQNYRGTDYSSHSRNLFDEEEERRKQREKEKEKLQEYDLEL